MDILPLAYCIIVFLGINFTEKSNKGAGAVVPPPLADTARATAIKRDNQATATIVIFFVPRLNQSQRG